MFEAALVVTDGGREVVGVGVVARIVIDAEHDVCPPGPVKVIL